MAFFNSIESFATNQHDNVVMTFGIFDGVHKGHHALLNACITMAQGLHARSLVMTFDPHPLKLFLPQMAPKMLQTLDERLHSLEQKNIDHVIVQNFDPHFASLEAEDFLEFLHNNLKIKGFVIGHDFTFGKNRRGDYHLLSKFCAQKEIALQKISPHLVDNILISSTWIRRHIAEGKVDLVADWLDRFYALTGTIVHGQGRGKTLGIRTANMKPASPDLLLPLQGVYATLSHVNGKFYESVTNIGHNPTFGQNELAIETHILTDDLHDIYDTTITVSFVKRLRSEIHFKSSFELVTQIQKDIDETRHILKLNNDRLQDYQNRISHAIAK